MGEDMTDACPHFHFVRKGFIAAVCKEKVTVQPHHSQS